jgi:hypothetical protein
MDAVINQIFNFTTIQWQDIIKGYPAVSPEKWARLSAISIKKSHICKAYPNQVPSHPLTPNWYSVPGLQK